jgi:rod shape determining protein RodA
MEGMLDKRFWRAIDWWTVLGLLGAISVGVALVYSASRGGPWAFSYQRQLLYVVTGFTLMLLVLLVDYHNLVERAEIIYIAVSGLLVYLLLFGSVRAGTKRWIEIGSFTLQPGEFAKLAVVLLLAKYFAAVRRDKLKAGEVLTTAAIAGFPACLVALQPDLGTAATLVAVYAALAFLAGLGRRMLVVLAVAVALSAPLAWTYLLKDYQKDRLKTFWDPESDPRGAGYQSIQAQIAVGSGGFDGKGWLRGSQNQLRFLPAPHTDFIFAVLAEEFGFVGVAVLLVLYLGLALRALDTARRARDRLGIYLVAGVLAVFVFQAAYNMAMVAGVVPVKGFPLPLMSFGGSSILATLIGFGVILNVHLRRFAN